MPTTIYLVSDPKEGESTACPTLKEAREAKGVIGDGAEITRVVIGDLPRRELYCNLYNRQQFAADQTPTC